MRETETKKKTTTRTVSPESDAAGKRRRKRSRYLKLASRYSGYVALRTGHSVLSRLPLGVGLALSSAVGRLGYLFARQARRNAVESLTRVYGNEFSEREIRLQVRDVFRHTIATAREPMCFSSQMTFDTPLCRKYSNASTGCSSRPGCFDVSDGDIVGGR